MPRRMTLFLSSLVAILMCALLGRVALAQPPQGPSAHNVEQPAKAQSIRHHTPYRKVPGSNVEIRVVAYDGATNGVLTVQLQNATPRTQGFAASGLYFVPEGDPNTAPQRLGAVGPLHLAAHPDSELQKIDVPPGATMEVALDVFCIDSHRSSPSPSNKFHVAEQRMPNVLSDTIESKANAAVAEERQKGAPAPRKAAKSKIQGEVWNSRDVDWIELDGEGRQERQKQKRPAR